MYDLCDMLLAINKYKKLYEKNCRDIMTKYELKIADIDVLYYIAHSHSKNYAKNIVDEGMSKAHVSKSVEHLREKGLVTLSADSEDRRCMHIKPTEAAKPIIEEIESVRAEIGELLTEGITEEEKEITMQVMRKLSKNIEGGLS